MKGVARAGQIAEVAKSGAQVAECVWVVGVPLEGDLASGYRALKIADVTAENAHPNGDIRVAIVFRNQQRQPSLHFVRVGRNAEPWLDGVEIVLKGGQVGPEDYFEVVRRGNQ